MKLNFKFDLVSEQTVTSEKIIYNVKNLPNTFLMNDEIREHIVGIANELESSEKDQFGIDNAYTDFCYVVRREMDD